MGYDLPDLKTSIQPCICTPNCGVIEHRECGYCPCPVLVNFPVCPDTFTDEMKKEVISCWNMQHFIASLKVVSPTD